MIKNVLNRLTIVAGLEKETNYIETARGISRDTWEDMNHREKKKYVDGHPNSIYYYEFYSKQAKAGLKKIKGQIKELKDLQGKYKSAKKQNEIQSQIDKLKKKGKKLQDFVKGLDDKFKADEVMIIKEPKKFEFKKPEKPATQIKPVTKKIEQGLGTPKLIDDISNAIENLKNEKGSNSFLLIDGNKLTDEHLKELPKQGNIVVYCKDDNIKKKLQSLNTDLLKIDIERDPMKVFVGNVAKGIKRSILNACGNNYDESDIGDIRLTYSNGSKEEANGITVNLPPGKAYGNGHEKYSTAFLDEDGKLHIENILHKSHENVINVLKDKVIKDYKSASEDFKKLIAKNGKICNITIRQEFD